MRDARLLMILLVTATVLVDLVSLSVVAAQELPPEPGVVVLLSLAMSQVSLIAIWTGFGGKWLPWRVMGLVLTILLWGRVMVMVSARRDLVDAAEEQSFWIILSLGQTAGILASLSIARLNGVKLVQARHEGGMQQAALRPPAWQFSVGYLLSWMTVVAAVLGLLHYMPDYEVLWRVVGEAWLVLAVLSLTNALLALVTLWATLGTRGLILRASVLALTGAAAIGGGGTLVGLDDVWAYAALCILCVLQVVWLLASLWVVRVAGYRIVGRPRPRLDERPDSADDC